MGCASSSESAPAPPVTPPPSSLSKQPLSSAPGKSSSPSRRHRGDKESKRSTSSEQPQHKKPNPESDHVPRKDEVTSASSVSAAVSTVEAKLDDGIDIVDAIHVEMDEVCVSVTAKNEEQTIAVISTPVKEDQHVVDVQNSDIEIEIEMGDEKEREERARSLFTMYRVRQAREDMDTLKQEAESEDGIFAQGYLAVLELIESGGVGEVSISAEQVELLASVVLDQNRDSPVRAAALYIMGYLLSNEVFTTDDIPALFRDSTISRFTDHDGDTDVEKVGERMLEQAGQLHHCWAPFDVAVLLDSEFLSDDDGDSRSMAVRSIAQSFVLSLREEDFEYDESSAREYLFQAAADFGNPLAEYELGMLILARDAYAPEALERFLRCAEVGHLDSQYQAALLLLDGRGVYGGEPDLETGEKWLVRASDAGHVEATVSLASLYATEGGPLNDENRAIELYRLAIKRGSIRACNLLGDMYLVIGVYPKALALYESAAAAGDAAGYRNCGAMYADGLGMDEPNLDKALDFFLKAALKYDIEAMISLARIYIDGLSSLGVDLESGKRWLSKASDLGSEEADSLLASIEDQERSILHDQVAEESFDEIVEEVLQTQSDVHVSISSPSESTSHEDNQVDTAIVEDPVVCDQDGTVNHSPDSSDDAIADNLEPHAESEPEDDQSTHEDVNPDNLEDPGILPMDSIQSPQSDPSSSLVLPDIDSISELDSFVSSQIDTMIDSVLREIE